MPITRTAGGYAVETRFAAPHDLDVVTLALPHLDCHSAHIGHHLQQWVAGLSDEGLDACLMNRDRVQAKTAALLRATLAPAPEGLSAHLPDRSSFRAYLDFHESLPERTEGLRRDPLQVLEHPFELVTCAQHPDLAPLADRAGAHLANTLTAMNSAHVRGLHRALARPEGNPAPVRPYEQEALTAALASAGLRHNPGIACHLEAPGRQRPLQLPHPRTQPQALPPARGRRR